MGGVLEDCIYTSRELKIFLMGLFLERLRIFQVLGLKLFHDG